MNRGGRTTIRLAVFTCGLVAAGTGSIGAEQIRMKGGKEIEGRVLQLDGDSVIIRLDRSSVESVNGKALPPPVTVGSTAPDFKAKDLAGTARAMADNRGHVTLLQFWASWCPHCRSDLSLMKKLFTQYEDKGLRLMTVSIDQDLKALTALIDKEQVPYPVISVLDQSVDLAGLYEMRGVPAYFLIDADGKIAKTWSGSVTETKGDLEDVLAKLLTPTTGT